ncbi:ABC transporter family protein [Trichomonas vaginalis G3]|uniref:ABC transporter family protein n=1 Tax=Trichomonas vaginalis (strain ATCC PRA-98 / G3) TaxID=412133 RepID=A2EN45_TRIV3|nr:ATPase activity, coupled to transmembrane movement of substances [Trichomonas vaginalis G3]EAY05882.1 ABC transporter family protein [Trichomonas vaginalis G3]KAI5520234.1 ATPase activity, coupled to transmembrane movement of substances [Trichomonas vaginalis G3]|eukprot:XP_001318105.1 ABC transporter family protein [Trichomonas vaginalis G3]
MPLIIIIFFAQGVNLMKLSPFLVIFPHWMLTMFLDNIMISYVYEIPFNFKNLVILTRWKNSWYLLLFTIALIVFYLLIYLILNVLLPRNDGAPPIGFSNILSLSAWKQIFNFKKSEYIENVNESFIEVTGIDKTYKGSMPVHALNDVSFTINKGDTVVLIGPNGSGKSTLLNAMTGSISSDQGVLRIYGCRCPSGFNALQDHLGICYQDNILFDKLSVYQHLELFATIRGVCCERVCEVVDECMSRFHLEGMDNMRSSKLSGGNKRKLCVAIAFIGSPKFVILDEPTSGMDTSMRQEMWKAISSYNITSIVSSHSVEEARSLTNRIFVMRSGELLFDGSPNELRRKFHCGYRLTPIFYIDGDKRYRDVLLRWMQTNVQGAIISPIRDEDILFPICDDVTELLEELEQKLPIFRMRSFNIIVEQLESVLYRMFIDDEN